MFSFVRLDISTDLQKLQSYKRVTKILQKKL